MFEKLDFEKMNEQDVREEIIAPLLKKLGYRTSTKNNIIREQSLKYPKFFLGRKKSTNDQQLRGKADYILEIEESIRWEIEAKSPNEQINTNTIEQAYTYAIHPEIRGIYFAVCNGRKLSLVQSKRSPEAKPWGGN